ncbi:thiol-disulfide oxidoreductase ResA [Caenibacillus caldisaponilyticus]|jgi:peroxiredoxin|uniref:thiol-disulfide oxidoreductase ResA n=1 Tax=Caenibacillus caldisaponilyticus TaxID=1674942 RepID=UPI0009885FF1|nr:thiol-disulfide oxidoreductase ResA [Caenibacillus caldisaponilyticus]
MNNEQYLSKRRWRLLMRTALILLIAAAVGFTIYQVVRDKQNIDVGDQAPDFALKTLDGKEVKLSDFRGQGVLLNFWGSWCDPCKEEMPYINEVYEKHLKNVKILAVNIQESPVVVRGFFERYGLKFTTVLDRDGAVTRAYHIGPIPTTFLIDKNGRIVKKITGGMDSPEAVEKNLKLVQP